MQMNSIHYSMQNQMQQMQAQMMNGYGMNTMPMTAALNANMNGIVNAINQSIEPVPMTNGDVHSGCTKGGDEQVDDDGDGDNDGYDEETEAEDTSEDAMDYDPMYGQKQNNADKTDGL